MILDLWGLNGLTIITQLISHYSLLILLDIVQQVPEPLLSQWVLRPLLISLGN